MTLIRKSSLVIALLISAVPAFAQEPGWELIGERTVDGLAERDVIDARPIVYATHLRLCVDREALNVRDVEVFYRNGNQQSLPIGLVVPAGGCTPDVELHNSGSLDLDRLMLSYGRAGPREVRPRIYVFALASRVLR